MIETCGFVDLEGLTLAAGLGLEITVYDRRQGICEYHILEVVGRVFIPIFVLKEPALD